MQKEPCAYTTPSAIAAFKGGRLGYKLKEEIG